jgi:putative ABC transport system permease protein
MIGHYLASALAKFRKAPFTTAANVFTLALGLACFIAAYGVASYWRSGDSHHPGAERLYYIEQSLSDDPPQFLNSRRLLEPLENISEVEAAAQIQGQASTSQRQNAFSSGERDVFLQIGRADAAIFDLLAFDFVEGGAGTAFRAPNDLVLTEDAARRLFGNEPALGRTLTLAGQTDYTVSGVIAPMRQPSFVGQSSDAPMRFDVLLNFALEYPEPPPSWGLYSGATIIRLSPSMSLEDFQARIDGIVASGEARDVYEIKLTAEPISELTSRLVDDRFLSQTSAGVSTSAVFMGLGALILLVACVNYANLAAAQSASRIKETGMRRVLGARWLHLLTQYSLEASLLAVPALGLAVLAVTLAAPVLRNVSGADAAYILTAGPQGVLVVAGIALASAAAAAAYPALLVARVRAADSLGSAASRTGPGGVARALVAVQFLSSSFLLIIVAVALLQQAHLKDIAFPAEENPVVILDGIPGVDADAAADPRAAHFTTFRTELLATPLIRSVTTTDIVPWTAYANGGPIAFSEEAAASELFIERRLVGPDYFNTLGLEILAGRALDPARDGVDTAEPPRYLDPVVIDRRLAGSLGYEFPQAAVGQSLFRSTPEEEEANPLSKVPFAVVVGVAETDQTRLAAESSFSGNVIFGAVFSLNPNFENAGRPAIRIDGNDVPGALAAIERVWSEMAPDVPFRARFVEDLFEEAYAPFSRITRAFIVLSACALAISTAGVLGIAVHVAARRRHEIGVRKTLGASTPRVLRMLIADFSKPVIVGNVMAWPLAWMAAQAYLQPFAERTPLTPLPFILSLAVTLLIAWFAVGGQAWKAARLKPALVLKAE